MVTPDEERRLHALEDRSRTQTFTMLLLTVNVLLLAIEQIALGVTR